MTKNEERNIEKCIRSVRDFGEVFVVDSGSTDRTCAIAKSLGAHVVSFTWDGKYPKKKQWCLENLAFSYEWVLYVDADEEVTPELALEIRELFAKSGGHPQHQGYFVGYDYLYMARLLRHGQRAYKLVLLDRPHSKFIDYDDLDAVQMWEVEGHYQPSVDGTIGLLKSPMLHTDHDDLFHYFDRHNRYSDWEAVVREKGRFSHPSESQLADRGRMKRIFERLPGKPIAAFAYGYLVKQGFRDGRAGFHFAIARSFYYWQVGVKQREYRQKQQR